MQKQSLDHDKRPWGEFQVIDSGDGFQVKRIIVLPGKRLSLQSHKFRKEHWVVSSGEAEVEINNKISKIFPEDSKYYFVQSKVGRARDAKEVRDIFKSNNRFGDYYKSIKNTIHHVKGISKENDIIFIGGSTFVVSDIFDKN